MDWRAHVLIGAVLAALVFFLLGTHDPVLLAVFSIFGALGALVPDLDHDSSKGRKILDAVFVVLVLSALYLHECSGSLCIPGGSDLARIVILFFAVVGAYFVLFRFFKPRHRGITHTLAACFVFGMLVYFVAGFLPALAGSVGYFSHLVADGQIKLL